MSRRALLLSASPISDFSKGMHGIHRRLTMIIEALARDHELDILFFVSSEVGSPAELSRLYSRRWGRPISVSVCRVRDPRHWLAEGAAKVRGLLNFFESPLGRSAAGPRQLEAVERLLARKPDLIFAHRLRCMAPLLRRGRRGLPPVYFDLDDVEHIKELSTIRILARRSAYSLLYYLQIPALFEAERRSVRMAAKTFVCSEADGRYVARVFGGRVRVVPNAVENVPPAPHGREKRILLLGNYDHLPNARGARFLIEEVWPLIRAASPEARLIVAGDGKERVAEFGRGRPEIEFPGYVEDLAALYGSVRVVCCPILDGGGTRVKMVEAAAYGKPIVATTIGAEGLAFRPGRDYLLADGAENFARACLRLLDDGDLRESLAASARASAAEHFDRARIVELIRREVAA